MIRSLKYSILEFWRRSYLAVWKKNKPIKRIRVSEALRVITFEPAILQWSKDNGETVNNDKLISSGLGLFYLDLATGTFKGGDTFYLLSIIPRQINEKRKNIGYP